MFSKLASFFPVFFTVITALQFLAGVDGLMHIFNLHWIFAGFAAAVLVMIPAIGPMVGLYGAAVVWKWNIWLSLFLFFWPYFIIAGLMLFGATKALMFWKKVIWPFYSSNPFRSRQQDIEPEFTVKESAPEKKSETLYIEYTNDTEK